MIALILAAGQGRRLLPLTEDRPKCLLALGERNFIEFQIDALRRAGVSDIGIVTGFYSEDVRKACGPERRYFHNADFETTNSLYSFMQAGDYVNQGCLLFNSDVVFHPALLDLLLNDPLPNVLLADFDAKLGEEEMKIVCDEKRRVIEISKDIAPWEAQAENLGLLTWLHHATYDCLFH